MLKENEAILKSRSDVVKKEEGTIESFLRELCWCEMWFLEQNVNIYLVGTLVGEYCSWRRKMLETRVFWSYCQGCFLFFSVFVFSRFSSILTGGGDGLALPWSLEKLPVKSSAVNCPNTFGQDCRLKGSKKLAHAQTKCLKVYFHPSPMYRPLRKKFSLNWIFVYLFIGLCELGLASFVAEFYQWVNVCRSCT